jgi:hypothetical protein
MCQIDRDTVGCVAGMNGTAIFGPGFTRNGVSTETTTTVTQQQVNASCFF